MNVKTEMSWQKTPAHLRFADSLQSVRTVVRTSRRNRDHVKGHVGWGIADWGGCLQDRVDSGRILSRRTWPGSLFGRLRLVT